MFRFLAVLLLLCGSAFAQNKPSPSFATTNTDDLNLAGTGVMAGAWTSTTGAVSSNSGTITDATSTIRYKKFGRTVFITVSVAITTNGTGAGTVNVTLPFAAAGDYALSGRNFSGNAFALVGVMVNTGNTLYITNYDGTYPGSDGFVLSLSGVYEAAN